jgi:hypothetical protein
MKPHWQKYIAGVIVTIEQLSSGVTGDKHKATNMAVNTISAKNTSKANVKCTKMYFFFQFVSCPAR